MISILATVDGSAESLSVLPALEKLAEDSKIKVQLLTVVERPKATPRRRGPLLTGVPAMTAVGPLAPVTPDVNWAESDDQAIQRSLSEGRDFLEAAAAPLREKGIAVDLEVAVENDVAKAIVDHARGSNFDLIAMATHGRGGLRELVQGSVASAVLRSGVVPVLLIRPTKSQVKATNALLKSRRARAQGVAT